MPTTEERLDQIEQSLREIRWRVGLGGPPPGERISGVPVGTAGQVLQPDQLPSPTVQHMELVNRIAKAQQTPPLSLAEACEKYREEETVTAYFKNPAALTDGSDYTRVQFPKGWQKVPKRFAPQLVCIAEVVPEAMDQP